MPNSTAGCKSRFQGKLRADGRIRGPNAVFEAIFACRGRTKCQKITTR